MARIGREPRYENPDQMQGIIDKYFEECESSIGFDKAGRPFALRPPTVTGLALALGFTSRQALLNYQAKKAFVDTVTRAKARCEEYAERRLFDKDGQRGAEFSLRCNFRWRDNDDETNENDGILEKIERHLRNGSADN